jgi:hypothetical protein
MDDIERAFLNRVRRKEATVLRRVSGTAGLGGFGVDLGTPDPFPAALLRTWRLHLAKWVSIAGIYF